MKMTMGYTGRGYRSTARRPYGYKVLRRPFVLAGESVWSGDSYGLLAAWSNSRDLSRGLAEQNATRSRPQSLVKSHQNEYDELITTDTSLTERKLSKVFMRGQTTTYQRRKSGCSPCHVCRVTELPCVCARSEITIRCAAERNITGKDDAYLIALKSGRRLTLVGDLYSMRHWRKRMR